MLVTVHAQTVEQLLERGAAEAENNLGAEPANLFTADERLMIQEYYDSEISDNTSGQLAIGEAYVMQIYGSCEPRGFCKFPLTGPYSLNVIRSTNTMLYAGDHDGAGNLYGLAVEGFIDEIITLVKIDKSTGYETVIDSLDFFPTGLAWNNVNNTMYALGLYNDATCLFTINLETAETTLIGETSANTGIWLAIDQDGNAFMADVGNDYLHSVNLETGASTQIGSIGVNISFAQDADFDPATGTLYTIGYHTGGANKLYSVNTTTGKYTSLGSVNNNCAQIGMLAIEGETVGVSEKSSTDFSFYPNPSNDILNIRSSENTNDVSIYDLLGQQIIGNQIVGAHARIDVSALNTGTYIIKVESNGTVATYRFLKN